MPRGRPVAELELQVVGEFESKILGTGCAVFTDRVQVYSGTEDPRRIDSVSLDDITFVDAVPWTGLTISTLVIQARGGTSLEVPMLPTADAKRAAGLIVDLMDRRVAQKQSA